MFARKSFYLLIIIFSFSICLGQQKFATDSLRIINRTGFNKENNGSPLVVHLNSGPGAGIAWINGQSFTLGTIEFDEKGKDVIQQSFVGIAFHGLNDSTYESVYFRPFNFRSVDPARKLHAVQYIAMPLYDWPVLRNANPGQYEKPVIPEPDPNGWFHVKIEVTDNKIRVFVNNNSAASLEVTPLVQLNGKMLGYWVGNGSDGDWKNLTIH